MKALYVQSSAVEGGGYRKVECVREGQDRAELLQTESQSGLALLLVGGVDLVAREVRLWIHPEHGVHGGALDPARGRRLFLVGVPG